MDMGISRRRDNHAPQGRASPVQYDPHDGMHTTANNLRQSTPVRSKYFASSNDRNQQQTDCRESEYARRSRAHPGLNSREGSFDDKPLTLRGRLPVPEKQLNRDNARLSIDPRNTDAVIRSASFRSARDVMRQSQADEKDAYTTCSDDEMFEKLPSSVRKGANDASHQQGNRSITVPKWGDLPRGRTMTLGGGIVLPFTDKDDLDDMMSFESEDSRVGPHVGFCIYFCAACLYRNDYVDEITLRARSDGLSCVYTSLSRAALVFYQSNCVKRITCLDVENEYCRIDSCVYFFV
jgi:hypothetical protein